jgi:hypothetical protein
MYALTITTDTTREVARFWTPREACDALPNVARGYGLATGETVPDLHPMQRHSDPAGATITVGAATFAIAEVGVWE